MNSPIIGKVYHNRCVLLDADHMAQVGITKNSQVSIRVKGDAIVIRKARVLDNEQCDQVFMDSIVSFIKTMTPAQVSSIKNALNLHLED